MPKYNYDRYKIIEPHEMEAWVYEAQEDWDLCAHLVFLYHFGARPAEPLLMTVQDIWREDGFLWARIPTLKSKRQTLRPRTLKVRIEGTPYLAELAHQVARLKAYDKQRGEEFVKLFPSRVFSYKYDYYYAKMKGLSHELSGNRFRHNRAFRMAQDKATAEELRDWFGWADVRPAGWYIRASGRLAQSYAERARVI